MLVVTNMWPRADRPSYGSFVAAEAKALAEAGVDVHVHVIAGDTNPLSYATDIASIRRQARSGCFDIVHAHYGLAGWTASWQPLPLVVSFCGTDLLGGHAERGARALIARLATRMSWVAARRARVIICKSEALRARLPRAEDRERAVVLANGVNLSLFAPGDRDAARRRLGWSLDEPIVLFPYDPARQVKRYALAAAAVAEGRRRVSDARLVTVANVPQQQMPDFYRAADCLLVTSRYEGSPNTVKEALACGLPVVSVDVGDARAWTTRVQGCSIVAAEPGPLGAAVADVLSRRDRLNPGAIRPLLDQRTTTARLVECYRSALTQ
ncbi:MAG TPA: glycosyltransferase [Gemmatimonadales bacterium]|nr:glycosyltransferase [Gemmatimonadales bacterium]